MTPDALPLPVLPSSPATLHGWRLTLARSIWAVCAAFAVALFLAYIPFNRSLVFNDWLVQSSAVAVWRYTHLGAFTDYVLTLRYLTAAISFGVAALIVWRKSDDAVALMVALGLLMLPIAFASGSGGGNIYMVYGAPWHIWLPRLRAGLTLFAFYYIALLFFIFPDGRFEPRWMRSVMLAVLALNGLLASLSFLATGQVSWEVWSATLLLWWIPAIGSQIYRYLRVSGPLERQQTKWFVAAVAFMPIGWIVILLGLSPILREPESNFINLHLQLAWFLWLPLGVGIGVLRRGLWGADPIINRTLVYGALTVCVVVLYVLSVGGLSTLFQSSESLVLSALVTGAIAFLFQPLRQWLQRLINRLMYGERDDPATVLARLGQRLETALAPEAVLPTIVQTVAQMLKVPYVALKITNDERLTESHPVTPAPQHLVSLPLIYQSETLGHLLVAPRAPGEAFSAADRRLVEQIAQQAAPAVHAYRLTADLQRSRERIVTAREEERRRLRRDLHDGLGPALASQTLKLDAALDLLEADPAQAVRYLREVKAQTQTTVADIRRLVYELRPPALDELGLVGALRAHVQSLSALNGLRVTVEAPPDLPPLSAAVEVAAYRIALEAVTNMVKHAQAHEGLIRLAALEWPPRKFLTLEIIDDGVGLPSMAQPGVGFASMHERAEELGGTCVLTNRQSGGVNVLAQLPIG